jgi:hypothetical protein
MLTYVPVPLSRIQLGRILPIDIWTPDGRLLLRRGQALQSEAHRDMLASHRASMTETDAQAWKKSLERDMRAMRQAGVPMTTIAQAPMPDTILDTDYLEGRDVAGGWLDLQEILRGLLYQGAGASRPLQRLDGIEQKALALLRNDPDECLFVLFQALPDLQLGYCATHALLSGAVSVLTAARLAQTPSDQDLLMRSALVMNIGMARPQDSLSRQHKPPDPSQRQIIAAHPPNSADILRGFGVQDDDMLAIVQWHHTPDAASLQAEQLASLRLLSLSDILVARMAPRISRAAMTPLGAAKSLVMETTPATSALRSAMAAVLGFYPPGTYVQLGNGEIAVVIKRGERATTPHVASIMSASGMPLSKYEYRDTSDARAPQHAVRAPVSTTPVRVSVSLEKVRRLRQQHGV